MECVLHSCASSHEGAANMGGSSGDGHAATPAWDYEVVTIVVVIGTSLLAFGLESHHLSSI